MLGNLRMGTDHLRLVAGEIHGELVESVAGHLLKFQRFSVLQLAVFMAKLKIELCHESIFQSFCCSASRQ